MGWRAYAFAAAAVLLAAAARAALGGLVPQLGGTTPFVTFFIAIAVSAWYGGLRAAMAAVLLGGIIGDRLFLSADHPPLMRSFTRQVSLAVFLVSGTAVALFGTLHARAQRRAESHAAQIHSILANVADAFFILDHDWRYRYANQRAADLSRRPPESLIGQRLWDVLPELADTELAAALRRAMDERVPVEIESFLASNDRWTETRAFPSPEGITVYVTDITHRRRAEAALRESEERLRLALSAGRCGAWDWDIRRNLVTWSEQIYQFHGLKPGEFEGSVEHLSRLVHPDDRQRVQEAIGAALEEDVPYELELRAVHPDGAVRWLSTSARVIRDLSGKPVRMLGATLDITDRKNAEREMQRLLSSERAARSEAEQASRMKDEFLATLSHELRTPLNAILGWSQLLRIGPTMPPEEAARALETIERNARIQAQLVDDLLDMSRILSGRMRLEVQPVELPEVIRAAVDTVQHSADAKGIRLVQVLDPGAGPVCGDPGRLQQVVWNLLTNAIKFTPRGGRVQVTLARVESHAEITVNDTGTGIAADFLPHVFERFRQADGSSTRRHGGLGLGLSIVKHLVELHGGTVSAHSEGEGRGARFVASLPLAVLGRGSGATGKTSTPAVLHAHAATDLSGLQVLVVDDEPDARDLLHRVLSRCSASVESVESSEQALRRLDEGRLPDVLISDIGMPDDDGYDLIRQIRARPAASGGRIPAIALTAFARADDRTRAVMAGFQVHLSKPVDPTELVAHVASLAGRTAGPTRSS